MATINVIQVGGTAYNIDFSTGYVKKSGDTMTGDLTIRKRNPTLHLQNSTLSHNSSTGCLEIIG